MNGYSKRDRIRFAIFADFHYKKGLYASTVDDLSSIMKRADESGAESSYLDGIIPKFNLGEEVSPKILSATFQIGETL